MAGGNVWAGIGMGAAIGGISGFMAGSAMMAMGAGATAAGSWGGLGGALISPMEGALITATEFAIGGFGSGLITGYAGGRGSFGDMLRSGAMGGALGYLQGFAAGYSYTAGWQSILHGADTQAINREVARQTNARTEIYGRLRVSAKRPETPNDTGHSWVTLKRTGEKPISYGFGPNGRADSKIDLLLKGVPGELNRSAGWQDAYRLDPGRAYHTWNLTKTQYVNVENYIRNFDASRWAMTVECTDFAVGALGAAEIRVPSMNNGIYSDPNEMANWLESLN